MRPMVVVMLAACGGSANVKPKPDAGEVITTCSTESECTVDQPYCDTASGTCVECRFSSHCEGQLCEAQHCVAASSCKELHAELPGLASGNYTIDPGTGPVTVYCDMVTAGGGWMALLNPTLSAAATHPALTATTMELSGTQSCAAATVPSDFVANGFHGLHAYACGTVTFKMDLAWPNSVGATDVMFLATLQGEATRTLTVNGAAVTPDGSTTDAGGATCVFYNATGATATLALNACSSTTIDAPPHVMMGGLSGDLALSIATGPACSPTCSHGTGMSISKLFVR